MPFLAANAAKNGIKIWTPSLREGAGVGIFGTCPPLYPKAGEKLFRPFLAASAAKNGLKILFASIWMEVGLGVFGIYLPVRLKRRADYLSFLL